MPTTTENLQLIPPLNPEQVSVYAEKLQARAEKFRESHKKTAFIGAIGSWMATHVLAPAEIFVASKLQGNVPRSLLEFSNWYTTQRREITTAKNKVIDQRNIEIAERIKAKELADEKERIAGIIGQFVSPFARENSGVKATYPEGTADKDIKPRSYFDGSITRKISIAPYFEQDKKRPKDITEIGPDQPRIITIIKDRKNGKHFFETVTGINIQRTTTEDDGSRVMQTYVNFTEADIADDKKRSSARCKVNIHIDAEGNYSFEYLNAVSPVFSEAAIRSLEPEIKQIAGLLTPEFFDVFRQTATLATNIGFDGTCNYDFTAIKASKEKSFKFENGSIV